MGQDAIPAYHALHLIARLAASVLLMWVSSHCGILYNFWADHLPGQLRCQDGLRRRPSTPPSCEGVYPQGNKLITAHCKPPQIETAARQESYISTEPAPDRSLSPPG